MDHKENMENCQMCLGHKHLYKIGACYSLQAQSGGKKIDCPECKSVGKVVKLTQIQKVEKVKKIGSEKK